MPLWLISKRSGDSVADQWGLGCGLMRLIKTLFRNRVKGVASGLAVHDTLGKSGGSTSMASHQRVRVSVIINLALCRNLKKGTIDGVFV